MSSCLNFRKVLLIILVTSPLFFCGKKQGADYTVPSVPDGTVVVNDGKVTVVPMEFYHAIRNPMKGLREFFGPGYDRVRGEYPYPYGSMIKEYMQWDMLENQAGDGVDKIIAYSNHRWKGVEDVNVKVIPRIFIVWMEPWNGGYAKNTYSDHPDDLNGWHWPSDIPPQSRPEDPGAPISGGYFHPTFQDRVKALVAKAAAAWDNDPRVAYVEMGIIGEWGEHHDPNITTYWAPHEQPDHVPNRTWIPGMEKTLGDAFRNGFKNKKVMVRYAYDFKDYEFGVYWDSWAQPQEQKRGYEEMIKLGDRWKKQPIGGEITWNWGDLARFNSFEAVVADQSTRMTVVEQIRNLHANHLGGITWTNFNSPLFLVNADLIQRSLGYRFVLPAFSYPSRVEVGEPFKISFKVVNTGSSPFYYDWPVEIALLDKATKQKVWGKVLSNTKISSWMPGEQWNSAKNTYLVPAVENEVEEELTIDQTLPAGEYFLSIAVLDPAGMQPSLRFAISNYFEGGRHPIGIVGLGSNVENHEVNSGQFFDLRQERTLKYKLN